MQQRAFLWAVILLFGVSINAHAQRSNVQPLGNLADPNRLLIEGSKTFTADAIKKAVLWNMDVLALAHPTAAVRPYAAKVQQKVIEGYWNHGFAQVDVRIRYDKPRHALVVTVTEGPQFKHGDVKIRGNKSLSKKEFKEATDKHWKPGTPASLSRAQLFAIKKSIETAYQRKGRYFSEVKMKVDTETPPIATLDVTVVQEGQRGKINSVIVDGNTRNTEAAIIAASGLKKGKQLNQSLLDAAQKTLYETGRFVSVKTATELSESGKGIDIVLSVDEHDELPKLTTPLTTVQKLLLKLNTWLVGFPTQTLGVELTMEEPNSTVVGEFNRLQVVITPKDGASVSLGTAKSHHLIQGIASPKHLMLAGDLAKRQFRLPVLDGKAIVTIALSVNERGRDGTRGEQDLQFHAGAGLSTKKNKDDPNFSLEWTFARAVFLVWSQRYKLALTSTTNGVATIESDDKKTSLKVDTKTGQLVELKIRSTTDDGQPRRLSIRTGSNLLEQAKQMTQRPNAYVKGKAFTSAFKFLTTELYPNKKLHSLFPKTDNGDLSLAIDLVLNLVQNHLMEPMDSAWNDKGGKTFKLPSNPNSTSGGMSGLVEFMARITDSLFEHGSWAWTVLHQAVLLVAGQSKSIVNELNQLVAAGKLGPIGALAVSALWKQIGQAQLAAKYSQHGLDNQSTAAYAISLAPFYMGNAWIPAFVRKAGTVIRGWSSDERRAILSILPKASRSHVTRYLDALADTDKMPIHKALEIAQVQLWTQALKDKVVKLLKGSAKPKVK